MFGKSVFESVLDRLAAEGPAAEERAGQAPGAGADDPVHGAHPVFTVFPEGRPAVPPRSAAAAYRAMDDADDGFDAPEGAFASGDPDKAAAEAAPAAPALPAHLLRTSPEEIAADLGLTGKETRAQLAELRRAFARDNHPDTAPADLRANATRRMTIANMLIDETLRRMRAETALGLRR